MRPKGVRRTQHRGSVYCSCGFKFPGKFVSPSGQRMCRECIFKANRMNPKERRDFFKKHNRRLIL